MSKQPKKSILRLLWTLICGICKVLWNNLLVRFAPRQYYMVILTGVDKQGERSFWQTFIVTQMGIVPVQVMIQQRIKDSNLDRCCCINLVRVSKAVCVSFYDLTLKVPLEVTNDFITTL